MSRFWQLFVRRFVLLVALSLGLVLVLDVGHLMAERPTSEWIEFVVLDFFVLAAASAVTAYVRLQQEGRMGKGGPPPS